MKNEILIYDEIGAGMFFEGITAKQFATDFEVATAKADEVVIRVNSPGGSVFDGLAIANTIARAEMPTRVVIDGLAASIASVIAIAADRTEIAETALMMTHAPWTPVIGDADRLREIADQLDVIGASMATAYQKKTGLDEMAARAEFLEDGENWYTAADAAAVGLADEIVGGLDVAACDVSRFDWIKEPPRALTRQAPKAGAGSPPATISDRLRIRLAAMNKRTSRLTAAD